MRFFALNDWLWSVAIAFILYWGINRGPSTVFGVPMTYYAINWIQAAFATLGTIAALAAVTRFILWFNLRRIHHYIWGKKKHNEDGSLAKDKDGRQQYCLWSYEHFKELKPVQQFVASMVLLLFFFSISVIIFLKYLSAGAPTL